MFILDFFCSCTKCHNRTTAGEKKAVVLALAAILYAGRRSVKMNVFRPTYTHTVDHSVPSGHVPAMHGAAYIVHFGA